MRHSEFALQPFCIFPNIVNMFGEWLLLGGLDTMESIMMTLRSKHVMPSEMSLSPNQGILG